MYIVARSASYMGRDGAAAGAEVHSQEHITLELAGRFRAAVESLGLSTQGVDEATCMRFLRGRSMHIENAARMFAQHSSWRASFVPLGHIPAEQVVAELKAGEIALQGHTKQGLPLVIVLACKHRPTPVDRVKLFFVHVFDRAIASAPSGVEKVLIIIDLNHISYKNVDIKGSIAGFRTLQNYYPERLGTIYMINVPSFFKGVWKMIATCLEKSTKEKIVFLEDHKMTEVLLSEVDAAILPSMYGGKADLVLLQDAPVPNCQKDATTLI